jgi:hypothetical protein
MLGNSKLNLLKNFNLFRSGGVVAKVLRFNFLSRYVVSIFLDINRVGQAIRKCSTKKASRSQTVKNMSV